MYTVLMECMSHWNVWASTHTEMKDFWILNTPVFSPGISDSLIINWLWTLQREWERWRGRVGRGWVEEKRLLQWFTVSKERKTEITKSKLWSPCWQWVFSMNMHTLLPVLFSIYCRSYECCKNVCFARTPSVYSGLYIFSLWFCVVRRFSLHSYTIYIFLSFRFNCFALWISVVSARVTTWKNNNNKKLHQLLNTTTLAYIASEKKKISVFILFSSYFAMHLV